MTAPKQQPANLRAARKEQTAAKKQPAKVTPIAEKAAATEAAKHPAVAKQQLAKKASAKGATARVAPVAKGDRKLGKPVPLTWTTNEVKGQEYWIAEGARHLYRVHQGDDGGWYGQQKLKVGSWANMAGKCDTREDAQQLAGWNEAGAVWLAYRDVAGVEFANLVETYGARK